MSLSVLKISCYLVARVEQSVYALLRTRDMAISRCKEFGIPVDWLLDSGVVGKVCFKIWKRNGFTCTTFDFIISCMIKSVSYMMFAFVDQALICTVGKKVHETRSFRTWCNEWTWEGTKQRVYTSARRAFCLPCSSGMLELCSCWSCMIVWDTLFSNCNRFERI